MPNFASQKLARLWKRFSSKTFRDSFVTSHLITNIAAQIAVMRDRREMTQTDLALAAGMRQSQISDLENPSEKGLNIKTIAKVASAFDVAVVVRFVPFSELARWAVGEAHDQMNPPSFKADTIAKPPVFSFTTISNSSEGGAGADLKSYMIKRPPRAGSMTKTPTLNWMAQNQASLSSQPLVRTIQ